MFSLKHDWYVLKWICMILGRVSSSEIDFRIQRHHYLILYNI